MSAGQQPRWMEILKRLESLSRTLKKETEFYDVGKTFAFTAIPQFNERVVDAVRYMWLKTRDAESTSGIAKLDAETIIAETLRATSVVNDALGIDAEFLAETLEEAFSESAMAGLGGAMYIEAAIRAGFAPWQQPHNPVDAEFDGLADATVGTYWVNAVHNRVEQYIAQLQQHIATIEPALRAAESFLEPLAPLLRVDALSMAASQIVQNILDALNALYTRVVESLSAYLAAKHLVEMGVAGAEAEQEMRVRLVATLESVLDNLALLENNIDALAEYTRDFADADEADAAAAELEELLAPLIEGYARDLGAWFTRLMANRWARPDAGVQLAWSDGRRARVYRVYPSWHGFVEQ